MFTSLKKSLAAVMVAVVLAAQIFVPQYSYAGVYDVVKPLGKFFAKVISGIGSGLGEQADEDLKAGQDTKLFHVFKTMISSALQEIATEDLVPALTAALRDVMSQFVSNLNGIVTSLGRLGAAWGSGLASTLTLYLLYNAGRSAIFVATDVVRARWFTSELAIEKSPSRFTRFANILFVRPVKKVASATGITYLLDKLYVFSLLERIGLYRPKAKQNTLDDLILTSHVREVVESYCGMLKRAAETRTPLQNIALSGPPGTGKTQIMRAVVHKLGDEEALSWSSAALAFTMSLATLKAVELAMNIIGQRVGVNIFSPLVSLCSAIGLSNNSIEMAIGSQGFWGTMARNITAISAKFGYGGYPLQFLGSVVVPGAISLFMAGRALFPEPWKFILFSGGDVFKYQSGQAIDQLAKALDVAEQQGKTIVVIDEADPLVTDREDSKESSTVQRQALAVLLARAGNRSPKSALALLTNRLKVIDPAIGRRIDLMVNVGLPGQIQREQLLIKYFKQYCLGQPGLIIENDFVTTRYVRRLAEKMKGLSGAEIETICLVAASRGLNRPDQTLTAPLLESVVQETLVKNAKIVSKWKYDDEQQDEVVNAGPSGAPGAAPSVPNAVPSVSVPVTTAPELKNSSGQLPMISEGVAADVQAIPQKPAVETLTPEVEAPEIQVPQVKVGVTEVRRVIVSPEDLQIDTAELAAAA